jgi:enoyl-CoA hydratase/carnithine racemase
MGDTVLYELDGHVATITYNRPESLNAVNRALRDDLNAAFARFRDEEEAWVAIVTGAGRAFCAGADVKDGVGATGTFAGTFWEKPTLNSFESGWEIFKPVIAAVNGHCLGYGLTLVTWCDFVLASDRAVFGFPEVKLGTPAIVGAIRLPQRINWQDAMELLLIGDPVDAHRAAEMGIVGRPPGAGRPARPAGDEGGGDAHRGHVRRRGRPLRRDDATRGRRHRRRPPGRARMAWPLRGASRWASPRHERRECALATAKPEPAAQSASPVLRTRPLPSQPVGRALRRQVVHDVSDMIRRCQIQVESPPERRPAPTSLPAPSISSATAGPR